MDQFDPSPYNPHASQLLAADRIRLRMKRTAEDIIEIGRDLIAAKERIGHGSFGAWLDAEFSIAERFGSESAKIADMNVASRFGGDEFRTVRNLSPKVLYLLAAPSTPEPVVQQVASGEIPANVALHQAPMILAEVFHRHGQQVGRGVP